MIFGSILGFSAYDLPVAVATLCSYINPLVAAWLGWLFYREPFGAREATAMGVIFLGVGLVKMQRRPSSSPGSRPESETARAATGPVPRG